MWAVAAASLRPVQPCWRASRAVWWVWTSSPPQPGSLQATLTGSGSPAAGRHRQVAMHWHTSTKHCHCQAAPLQDTGVCSLVQPHHVVVLGLHWWELTCALLCGCVLWYSYASAACPVTVLQHNIFIPSAKLKGKFNKVCTQSGRILNWSAATECVLLPGARGSMQLCVVHLMLLSRLIASMER